MERMWHERRRTGLSESPAEERVLRHARGRALEDRAEAMKNRVRHACVVRRTVRSEQKHADLNRARLLRRVRLAER